MYLMYLIACLWTCCKYIGVKLKSDDQFHLAQPSIQVVRKNNFKFPRGGQQEVLGDRKETYITDGSMTATLLRVDVCVYTQTFAHHTHAHSHVHVFTCYFLPLFPTESRWLKVTRRSPRARCLPMPSLCRRAVRNTRKRTQRFQSTLQSFPRSAQRGGRYLNLWLLQVTTSCGIC